MDRDEEVRDAAWRGFMESHGSAEPPAPERLRRTLSERGLPGGSTAGARSGRRIPIAGAAAAAAIFFALGLGTGLRISPRASAEVTHRYALFVIGEGRGDVPEAVKIREYGTWIRRLADSGIGLSGERLGETGWRLDPDGTTTPVSGGADPITGFFIISAPNPDSALALARGNPHLAHGGQLLLRPIEQD